MPVSDEDIVAAAEKLASSDLRAQLVALIGAPAHMILPVIRPFIGSILVLADAGNQIAEVFRGYDLLTTQLHSTEARVVDGCTLPYGLQFDAPLFGEGGVLESSGTRVRRVLRALEINKICDLYNFQTVLLRQPGFEKASLARVIQNLKGWGFRPEEFRCLGKPFGWV